MKQSKFQEQAAAAAQRIEQAQALGEQLTFLADPDGDGGQMVAAEPRAPGRPKGSKNKTDAKLREMLAAKGFRMPEDVLAEIAGLSSREDVLVTAMARAERVLAWAQDGAAQVGKKNAKVEWLPSGSMRLSTFVEIYKSQIKALEALLPYGLGKVTPDTTTNIQSTTIVMPGSGAPGDSAKVVNGKMGGQFSPPPMPEKMQQNQDVENADTIQSDGGSRTE